MDLKHLVERLKHAFNMEQHARKQGGWGVAKPFKSIDDSLYGAAITKLEEQRDKIRRLTDSVERLHNQVVRRAEARHILEVDEVEWVKPLMRIERQCKNCYFNMYGGECQVSYHRVEDDGTCEAFSHVDDDHDAQ